jgi:sugar lactone lactonase YvrE
MKIFRTAVLLALTGFAAAQTTRTWEQSKFEEFAKGTSKGVAIRSDGTLELAPEFTALATTPSTYIWSAASNAQGDLFAAAGAPARLYRVTPEGKVTVVLSPPELQVQAVVCAPDGTIFAATSPDGKVYRIQRGTPAKLPAEAKSEQKNEAKRQDQKPSEPKTEIKADPDPGYVSSVFFEPKTKYIWALALDSEGRLYVATGDKGEIYRVDREGKGSVFFSSDETHIRSLAFDSAGNLIAGSDGSGLIYRISPRGEGFVLYSATKKEITALAVDSVGVIYAAGAGDKKATAPIPLPAPVPAAQPAASGVTGPNIMLTPGPQPNVPVPGMGATGSEIYRIDTDGTPRRLWSSREDLVYSLAIDHAGRLLAGTGNKGRIFAVFGNGNYTDLLKASANQVAAFASAPGGALYAATSNLGKILLIRESSQREGTFDSDVFDARMLSQWGKAEVSTKGNVELFARAGNVDNPDRNWSPWLKLDPTKDYQVLSPAARFLQWRAVLRSGPAAPQVESVRINYLPRNIAPEIDEVVVSVGNRFSSAPRTTAEGGLRGDAAPAPTRDHGSIAIRWAAHDENDDQLTYSIYYRGENEKRWLPLKTGLANKFYSFDSNLIPDGAYVVKVVASDAPSQSPGSALTASRESVRFEVDNTPPQVTNLVARVEGDKLRVSFTATDALSIVRRAEFSLDGGDWQFVAPVGGISDSKTANYEFTLPLARGTDPEDHLVVVRVYDRADNMGLAKTSAVKVAK